jgi:hypothetical protein
MLARDLEVVDVSAQEQPAAQCAPLATSSKKKRAAQQHDVEEAAAAADGERSSKKKKKRKKSSAAAAEAEAAATILEAAAAGGDSDTASTGVRLFRAVRAGTPCVLRGRSGGGSKDYEAAWGCGGDTLRALQLAAVAGSDAEQQQLQAQLQRQGQQQEERRRRLQEQHWLRDSIPRLCAAQRSFDGRAVVQHAATLAVLAVDGRQLAAAAAAALAVGVGSSDGCSGGGNGGSSKSKPKGSLTKQWMHPWRRLKGQKDRGVVVEAREGGLVPQEARIAKLLGG